MSKQKSSSGSLADYLTEKVKARNEKNMKPSPRMEILSDMAYEIREEQQYVTADTNTEAVALYTRSADNVLKSVTDKTLEVVVYGKQSLLPNREVKEVMRLVKTITFADYAIDLSTVQPVAFADELTTPTWNRLKFRRSELAQVQLKDLPEFTHILSLCDDPDSLVLWIGSLLDPLSGRTQYLHLHGGGGNGKSTLFNAIGEVLGLNHVVYTRADEFQNQHWGSQLEGKRLLVFPDENNAGFFSSGKFKEFTGEDTTSVNPKYEKPRTIRLTHKTAVFSNNRVEISDSVADRRRLLSISMADDPDGTIGFRWWYKGLKDSGPKILAYCFHEYEKARAVNPSLRAFILQEGSSVDEAIDRKYAPIFDVLQEHYNVTKSESDYVRRSSLHKLLAEEMRDRTNNRFFIQQVREALIRLGVTEGRNGQLAVYKGLKAASGVLKLASISPQPTKGGST